MPDQTQNLKISSQHARKFIGQMLEWYDKHRRPIPWRASAGEPANPYYIWLSEIMCQQTTVQAVVPYFLKFTSTWPTVFDMAADTQEAVMDAWAGLGYYARARNLHKCANVIVNDHDGLFPAEQDALKKLPGIGDYTSAAIMTMAFNKPATVVDGNVERVMSRYFAIEQPLPKSKPALKHAASLFFDKAVGRPGDFAQSLMDLGAMVCTPKSPKCMLCPVRDRCRARRLGVATMLPKKEKKKAKPQKHGYIYWITDGKERVLLHRRPDDVLLGGSVGLPTSAWLANEKALTHIHDDIPAIIDMNKTVHHGFTHFDLTLMLMNVKGGSNDLENMPGFYWENINTLKNKRLPTVFQKALDVFLTASKVEVHTKPV